jgi:RND family efflux transporter MFP subunit
LEVGDAKQEYETAKLELEMAQRDVARCMVRSPIDGFVGEVEVVSGEVIDVNTSLTEVYRLDPIHVRVDFPQERTSDVRIGQTSKVVLDSFPEETFTGTIVRVAAEVDPTTRVLPVVVELPNPEFRIKSGVSGFVRTPVTHDATTIPTAAVIERDSQAMVFVVDGNRAKIRKVRTGAASEGGFVEIRGGLAAGEEVVLYGQHHLMNDDVVNVNWRAWARRDQPYNIGLPIAGHTAADGQVVSNRVEPDEADRRSPEGN